MHTTVSTSVQSAVTPEKRKLPIAVIRRRARELLGGHSDGVNNRLILILAMAIIMAVAMTVYLVLGGVYSAAAALWGELPTLDAVLTLAFGVSFVCLILPMLTALWRMACLMTAPDGETVGSMRVSVPSVSVADVFYPFSSPRAYGRTMTVAMDGIAWLILPVVLVLITEVGYAALTTSESLTAWLTEETLTVIADILRFCCVSVSCGVGLLTFFLSGRRAGFGYYVFVCDDWSMRDVRRFFRGFGRSPLRVLALRLSLVGWMLLSIVGFLLPLVIHAAPYGLLCSACYAASLPRKKG